VIEKAPNDFDSEVIDAQVVEESASSANANSGNDQSVNQPHRLLAVNFIIAVEGYFPSRN